MTKISQPRPPQQPVTRQQGPGPQAAAAQAPKPVKTGWGPPNLDEPLEAPKAPSVRTEKNQESPEIDPSLLARALATQDSWAPKPADSINALMTNAGFKQLSAADQASFTRRVSSNAHVSASVREQLGALMKQASFVTAGPAGQAAALSEFLSKEVGVPALVAGTEVKELRALPASIGAPEALPGYTFDSKPADAQRYPVTIGGHTIQVIMATPPAENQPTIQQVTQGLSKLPAQSLAAVGSVLVEPAANPQDAFWAKVYNHPEFHSYMTAGSEGVVRVYPATSPQDQATLDGSLIHETGHTLSKRLFGENCEEGPKWGSWNLAASSDAMHPSQYARASPDEDFAETLELYQQVRGTSSEPELRKLYPARFAILDSLTAPAQ